MIPSSVFHLEKKTSQQWQHSYLMSKICSWYILRAEKIFTVYTKTAEPIKSLKAKELVNMCVRSVFL